MFLVLASELSSRTYSFRRALSDVASGFFRDGLLRSPVASLVAPLLLFCLTARFAALRLAVALLGEELLVLRGKEELATAVGAGQFLVLVRAHFLPPFFLTGGLAVLPAPALTISPIFFAISFAFSVALSSITSYRLSPRALRVPARLVC